MPPAWGEYSDELMVMSKNFKFRPKVAVEAEAKETHEVDEVKEVKEVKEAKEAKETKEAEGEGKDEANAADDDDLSVRAMLLSLAHVYYYRLPREVNRQQLCGNWNPHWTLLGESLSYEEFDLVRRRRRRS